MKLKQIGEKTYYIENDTNIGIYMTGPDRVCLIDTGHREDGEKIDKIISEQGWTIDFIINTHTHIDHIGGNEYLMSKYGIPTYCTDIDMAFAHYSDLEPSYMNGGRPGSKLRHVFRHPGKIGFKAIEDITPEGVSEVDGPLRGLSWMPLKGHTFGMIGIKTSDDIWFLGDSYLSKSYMEKRNFAYLCDVEEYMANLEMLKNLDGKLFVPSHGLAEEDITEILQLNVENQQMLIDAVKEACSGGKNTGKDDLQEDFRGVGLDRILQQMYEVTMLRNNEANHVLLSSTVKCYLTYLEDRGEIECGFEDNVMVWKIVK